MRIRFFFVRVVRFLFLGVHTRVEFLCLLGVCVCMCESYFSFFRCAHVYVDFFCVFFYSHCVEMFFFCRAM